MNLQSNSNGQVCESPIESLTDLERKIDSITKSLSKPYFNKILKDLLKFNPANAKTIVEYILTEQTEINIKDSTKESKIKIMSILKTGYHYTKFVTRINPNTGIPEKFFAYCSKIIIREKPLGPNIARGVNDRILPIMAYVGNPKCDIKEILNPTETGGLEYQELRNEIEETKKILFGFRLIHFKDSIPNINVVLKGRDKELTKPYLQLFSNPISEDDKVVYDEVRNTLNKLLEIKRTKKISR